MIDDLKVDLSKFKKFSNAIIEREIEEISFEFIVGSLFPNVMNNIKEEMRRQYTLGFAAGQKGETDEE